MDETYKKLESIERFQRDTFIAIKEMDEAQRYRMDHLIAQMKNIATMANWCAAAAGFYIGVTVVGFFK